MAAGGQDELGSKDTRGVGIMWLHTLARNAKKITFCVIWSAPIFEMKWRPRAFSRVSIRDSDILSSCDMNDEHA